MNNFTATGMLFNTWEYEQVLKNSVTDSTTQAVDIFGSRTPVLTGNLLSRWDTESTLSLGGEIAGTTFNDTFYAGFANLRSRSPFYFERSLPEIEETFIETIIDSLGD